MLRRVVVTGTGAVTPIGLTSAETWQSIKNGKSGTGILTQIDNTEFYSKVAAEVKGFDALKYLDKKNARKTDPFLQFAIAASFMAIEESGLDMSKEDPFRCGVLIGSGIGGLRVTEENCFKYFKDGNTSRVSPFMIPMLICNMASGLVAMQFSMKGPNSCIVTACATGTHAIGDAMRMIQHGDADVMLAGGTESCITPLGFGGFCAMKALTSHNDSPETASRPFDRTRNGFIMGEGCGVLLLEEYEHAKKRGATIMAEIAGFGMSADATHITAPDAEGRGGIACMQAAMKDAKINADDIDYINAHGTSTVMNDKTETVAIKKALGEDRARRTMISSTKSMTGHLLGAAGGVEALICVKVIQESVVPPTINLNEPDPECDLDYVPNTAREHSVRVALTNSFGFGGHNATLAIKAVS
ncbi:MAG: beta-ketoacyl-ACP synthase II [Candidatus Omnitrophica bacterium]|nr:beta-ketoacyl-ACP synthase II [Candidatus Omnitrophota bacterium]